MLACEICETFINTFFSRAPPVASSVESFLKWFLNPAATSCAMKFCFVKWSIFKKYDFLKKLQVKVRSTSKRMSVFVFYLWRHLWQTFRTAANFLYNFLYRAISISYIIYIISYKISILEIQDSLYWTKFSISHFENCYKCRVFVPKL